MIPAKNRNPQHTLLNVDQLLPRYDDGDRQELIDGEVKQSNPYRLSSKGRLLWDNKWDQNVFNVTPF
jgi:hypothetical protein